MKEKKLTTKFAHAERTSNEVIKLQKAIFNNNEILNKFLGKIPAVFFIVNDCRQIVYMNEGALEFTGLEEVTSAIGKRPGELFGCIHSTEEEGGCGTSESCTYCGAVIAVLISQKGKSAVEDCRLVLGPNEAAYDLRVWASPLTIEGEKFHAVTIQDIGHEKRRIAMERIFFHDILNTTTSLMSTLDLLTHYSDKINQEEFLKMMNYKLYYLIDEIQSQRLLNDAENNDLTISSSTFNSLDVIKEVMRLYGDHDLGKEKSIQIDKNTKSVEITSDRTILRRVISNILKNALEATPEYGTITVGCKIVDGNVQFWVHNPGFIPRDVQMQIFQRSFSTKGFNRGLGTYSMKLLSSFLSGNVTFSTSKEKGTTFKASYPKILKKQV